MNYKQFYGALIILSCSQCLNPEPIHDQEPYIEFRLNSPQMRSLEIKYYNQKTLNYNYHPSSISLPMNINNTTSGFIIKSHTNEGTRIDTLVLTYKPILVNGHMDGHGNFRVQGYHIEINDLKINHYTFKKVSIDSSSSFQKAHLNPNNTNHKEPDYYGTIYY